MNRIENTEYGAPNRGCIRPGEPKCPHICVIPAFTVEDTSGVRGFADCFVHVLSINTTYYIDDKHRIITTWAGDLEIDDYDYEANPLALRSQTVFDFANNRGIRYNKTGGYKLFPIGDTIMTEA